MTAANVSRAIVGLALLLVLAAPGGAQEEPFPHEEHAGLFPLCTGCHVVPTDEADGLFPEAELRARCHDGAEQELVEWTEPAARRDLTFVHADHESALAGEDSTLACADCHSEAGTPRMEAVFRTSQETCFGCHAHETQDHYVTGACTTCHMPLAETSWSADKIAAITTPVYHDPADPFLAEEHGPGTEDGVERCATCHTQDRCTACHVNATAVSEIQALPAAPVHMTLPEAEARYPTPPSHEARNFLESHADGNGGAECSTCHTQDDCASCHLDVRGNEFREVFAAADVVAPGVGIEAVAPATHETPFFMVDHPTLATTDEGLCASCHTQPFCNDCHDEARTPEFHEPNFVQRHSADAYGRNMECATCHSTEVFCRACHIESGMGGSGGRLSVGYHDAEPVWLLRHGQAARQYLETCQSCHTQRECVQCHSQGGTFGVNPHGPDFDARRAQERNPAVCFACHLTDPSGGGG